MTDMFQLIYISSARAGTTAADCADILAVARRNNGHAGVTGLLLFNGKRFLQALEGPETDVRRIFDTVSADPRHRAVVSLSEKSIETREFGDWTMAYEDIGKQDAPSLKQLTTSLLDKAGPSTRALFETTAELHRTA